MKFSLVLTTNNDEVCTLHFNTNAEAHRALDRLCYLSCFESVKLYQDKQLVGGVVHGKPIPFVRPIVVK